MKRVLGAGALGTILLAGALVVAPTAAHAAPVPEGCDESGACALVFGFTGEVQSWTVPEGATQLSFEVQGASGYGHWFVGGLGGSFTTDPADIVPGTQFAIAVGQGGQGTVGGWGGGGDGGPVIGGGEPLYAGLGGGGGSYVFFAGDDAPWAPFAVAGGGTGGAGGGTGLRGGGANLPGQGLGGTYGSGGTLSAPGAGGMGLAGSYAPGSGGTGPASYAPLDGFIPGTGGDGGYAENAPGGSGSGAGGGYYGGGGGSGGIAGSGFNGLAGGGGSGFLASGYSAQPLAQPGMSQNSSRDGRVSITWQITQDTTDIQTTATAATVGQPVTLTAALDCTFGAEGGTVTFASGGSALGTATVDEATQEAFIEFTPDAAGTLAIDVDYDGRGGLCSEASGNHNLVVSPAASIIVSATATPARLLVDDTTVLSASVECDTAVVGELVFSRSGSEIGRAAVDSTNGAATLEYVPQAAGDDPVAVDFVSDDGNCAPASASIELTVTAASTVVPDPEDEPLESPGPGTTVEPKPALVSTGAEPGAMLAMAAALLALGGGLLGAVRRSRRV
ncbi:Ig-like domain-containing protein [Leucobacter celer]|uniref:Ig-like domain-containing protein n=1 Tax=Leucobacter celer TaxID=668625 RepID=UPI0006A76A03|nr:Ig-like domain-containing protein [Leucobacter celer]